MLVEQPNGKPTRKMRAVAIAGAISTALVAGTNYLWPGVGDQLSPVIWVTIPAVTVFIAGYFTKEEA